MKYALAAATMVLLVGAGVLGLARPIGADDRQAVCLDGRITPLQWHDALGVYAHGWKVTVTVKYGDQVYDTWTGPTIAETGCYHPVVHQQAGRTGATVEVTVAGGFLYSDRQIKLDLGQAEKYAAPGESLYLGTIIMQRRC
jgi:hypothetical protein